ncbi:hypothetical protein EGJ27_10200 [Pseudomonas sp. v388]|uniref:hypothetical protein n=1 Tax=Pseudomonas sp. v388 TaxID=2479849 RepID=UPI000F76CD10|nr:hypothetical protein [Pseudomonas sp. v388]RRV08409.1 hypothetical protein EGJ27_10200 [Pseudomonas sp. v388]
MPKPIWGDLPPARIKMPEKKVEVQSPTVHASQVLRDIGDNDIALNSVEMEKRRMKPLFKHFNPEQISAKELGRAGMLLYKTGFIDNLTAELMNSAGEEFDKQGNVVDAEKPLNALEFFAGRIARIQEQSLQGDPYAKALLPDYIRTVHVIKNLYTFVNSGNSPEMVKMIALEKQGKIPKGRPMRL